MLIINHSTRFLIATDTGEIPTGGECGLYDEDTRCLSEYLLRCDGKALILFSAQTLGDQRTEHFLVNNEAEGIQHAVLALVRRRTLGRTLREELTCTNFGNESSRWTLDLSFDADFANVAAVRKAAIENRNAATRRGGFRTIVEARRGLLRFRYEHEEFRRELEIHLPQDAEIYGRHCRLQIELRPRDGRTFTIEFVPRTGPRIRRVKPLPPPAAAAGPHHTLLAQSAAAATQHFPADAPTLDSDCDILCQAYRQSLTDFAALRLRSDAITGDAFVLAGGIPWYLALFGRDSLVACYQALPFAPEAARGILRTLAALQGEQVDERRGEEPGKIPHEHRFGTITGTQSGIPAYPHYRSIDSTPLFLILLAAYHRLTGDLDLVRELWPHALRALKWIDEYGDRDGDGYLEYQGRHDGKISNQGWKDSSDAIRCRNGSIPHGDIALCEAQGYAYAARLGLAGLAEALAGTDSGPDAITDTTSDTITEPDAASNTGDAPGHDLPLRTIARRQRAAAAMLREHFNHDFWLPDRHFFAQALAGSGSRKTPVDSLTSNPGQLLWTGIADEEKARALADTLLSPDFFSGWGIRTMARSEAAYNPVSYQSGSVWPHDNSLIAAGLARYQHSDHAARIIGGLIDALSHAADRRLPELFTGYGTDQATAPVQYPMACRPQAWATGAIFLLISTMVGLDPAVGSRDGSSTADDQNDSTAQTYLQPFFPGEPFLPPSIDHLQITGLYLRRRRLSITLTRTPHGIDRQLQTP